MSVSNALRRLAAIVDEVEADDVEVRDATIPAERTAISDGKVHVTLDLAVALDETAADNGTVTAHEQSEDGHEGERAVISGTVSESPDSDQPASQSVEADSGSRDEDATDVSPRTDDSDADSDTLTVEPGEDETADDTEGADTTAGTDDADDGPVVCPEPDCEETFESVPGMKIHRTKIHLRAESDDESGESTPAYRDPDALRAAYESHDSFPAMREALDVDVSAQTIRRHMIQHGIHDPDGDDDTERDVKGEVGDSDTEPRDSDADPGESTPDAGDGVTGTEADEQEPDQQEPTEAEDTDEESAIPADEPLADVLPSDVAAPADVTFAELKETVRTAETLYDIQQRFDLDRTEARDLLGYLDLLELVHGRVATKHEREELKAEIDSRIRHSIRGNGTSA